MTDTRATVDWLASERIRRIVLMLVVLAAPHMLWMPPWATALFLLAAGWRVFMAQHGATLRPRWILHVMTLACVAIVYLNFGGLNGQQPGVTLLVMMTGMKLLETRNLRDCRLLTYLGILLLLGQFLFTQDLPWMLWLGAGVVLLTMVQLDLQHPQSLLPWRRNLRTSTWIVAKALPLAVLFFVLFPRIPGPLWGLPSDASSGRAGLSDSMTPGSISSLALSDEVAFRVRFSGGAPPAREMYWRGPVLVTFDGLEWEPRPRTPGLKLPVLAPAPTARSYEIQLEAHGRRYLPALERVIAPLPPGANIAFDYVLEANAPVVDARLLTMSWIPPGPPEVALDRHGDPRRMAIYRQLPRGLNPQTAALAQSWIAESGGDTPTFVARVLQHFRQEEFRYTLNPGLLTGIHRMDQFLFETRAGFCEHYAAAFVVLMRAAGVPARVVTGYQGAERNGSYYIVRQSDAHAWAEIWTAEQGWQRIDPTAAIAPERIELGLGGALSDSPFLPLLARGQNFRGRWLSTIRLRWDRVDAFWNRAILAFGPELQRAFLSRFGLGELQKMLFALVSVLVLFGLSYAASTVLANRRRPALDPLAIVRDDLIRRSALKLDAARGGPQQIAVALQRRNQLDPEARRLLDHYERLRYAQITPATLEQVTALRKAIRAWKPQRPSEPGTKTKPPAPDSSADA